MVVSEFEYYGRVAFEAFRLHLNSLFPDGTFIPEWENLGDDLQQAWISSGDAAVKAYQGEE